MNHSLDGYANYGASKGGVNMLMKTMAQELGPLEIRVNSIAPGALRHVLIVPLGKQTKL